MENDIAHRYKLCNYHVDGLWWDNCSDSGPHSEDCEIEKARSDPEYVAYRTPPEICSVCGIKDPECGWSTFRDHDPHDRTCWDCAHPPYGSGKNIERAIRKALEAKPTSELKALVNRMKEVEACLINNNGRQEQVSYLIESGWDGE